MNEFRRGKNEYEIPQTNPSIHISSYPAPFIGSPGRCEGEGEVPAPSDTPPAGETITTDEAQPVEEITEPTDVPEPPSAGEVQPTEETAIPAEAYTETPTIDTIPAEDTSIPTVEDVVALAPDGVTVVPFDLVGSPLTMAEEATTNSYVSGDPILFRVGGMG